MKFIRQLILEILLLLRQSPLRRPILKFLVWTHNWAYHMISLFASPTGVHPKHAIQQYHKFFVSNIKPANSVLDIGCGHGDVTHAVAKKAREVTGIDISAKNIAIAKSHYNKNNLDFITGDALNYKFTNQFDAIILSNVLEHIENRIDFLKKLAGLAPKILIRVPLITRDWISVYKKNEGFEYRLDDTHFIEYEEKTFADEIKQAGLVIESLKTEFGEFYAVVRHSK